MHYMSKSIEIGEELYRTLLTASDRSHLIVIVKKAMKVRGRWRYKPRGNPNLKNLHLSPVKTVKEPFEGDIWS